MKQEKHKIAYDCKYFLGDRPCVWHKKKGLLCKCKHYAPLRGSLLVIKLDAAGDVLRTTCVLPVIARAWPGMRTIWITRKESIPLLENNPYITEVASYGTDAMVCLSSQKFSHVINLDASKISAGMATMARAKKKSGYILHEDGYVVGTNSRAEEWLRMGIFDDIKKANKRTYQEIICSILGLPAEQMKYVLELTEAEKREGRAHLAEIGIDLSKPVIGIHAGGGERWPLKQWGERNFIAFISEIANELGQEVQILLIGGTSEREINKRIVTGVNVSVFNAGCDNKVRHFAALVNCCSVVLSSDSLPMHIALAMGRRVVVLFGPTSSAEIELFGLGEKIVPDLDCLVCYKNACDFHPNCMDSISVDMVKQAVLRQLANKI